MVLVSKILIAVVVFFPSLLTVTYVLSVTSHHVHPFWPFISYTGNKPVESCIFSLGFNIVAGVYALLVYLRYCQFSAEIPSLGVFPANVVAGIGGAAGALGLSMVGSFQQRNFSICHYIGLILCFYGTYLYMIYQTKFSFFRGTPVLVKRARFILCVLAGFIHLVNIILVLVAYFSQPQLSFWVPSQNSNLTIAKAILQWILFFVYLIFFAFFYVDFKRISLKGDRIIFVEQIPTQT